MEDIVIEELPLRSRTCKILQNAEITTLTDLVERFVFNNAFVVRKRIKLIGNSMLYEIALLLKERGFITKIDKEIMPALRMPSKEEIGVENYSKSLRNIKWSEDTLLFLTKIVGEELLLGKVVESFVQIKYAGSMVFKEIPYREKFKSEFFSDLERKLVTIFPEIKQQLQQLGYAFT